MLILFRGAKCYCLWHGQGNIEQTQLGSNEGTTPRLISYTLSEFVLTSLLQCFTYIILVRYNTTSNSCSYFRLRSCSTQQLRSLLCGSILLERQLKSDPMMIHPGPRLHQLNPPVPPPPRQLPHHLPPWTSR